MVIKSCMMWLLTFLIVLPLGCSETVSGPASDSQAQHVRVRLIQDVEQVGLSATANIKVSSDSQPTERVLSLPSTGSIPLTLDRDQWKIGNFIAGRGVLTVRPTSEGNVFVNGSNYRGFYRFVPVGGGKFDVINDVNIDDYLKGVVAREMYPSWHIEAYKAQAIVAHTYALYIANTSGLNRYWDLYADQRDQVYGGIGGETSKSVEAVSATSRIVLTYGPDGGKIFKAYFSSCCGGITAAAADAFPGDPYIPPLAEHVNGNICNASHYFNWGPIIIKKEELARRFKIWAEKRSKADGRARPELAMAAIYRIDVVTSNRYGRPSRVLITDTRGAQFNWPAEDMRSAVNTDAAKDSTLPSSFCKINGDPNLDSVTFFDGHGYGHGVGMCQYCAEARASAGESHEQILASAFPQAKLVRAY